MMQKSEQKNMRWRRWAIFLLFVAVAVTGYLYARSQPQMLAEETGTKGETVTFGASILVQYHYALCGHDLQQEADVRRYIGLSEEELEEEFPGFAIKKFSPEDVVLQKHYACYCPKHILAYLEGEEVVLKQCADFEERFEEVERIGIFASQLSKEDREALLAGKVFASVPAAQKFCSAYRRVPTM